MISNKFCIYNFMNFKQFMESDLGFSRANNFVYPRERWSNPSRGSFIEAEIARQTKGMTDKQKADELLDLHRSTRDDVEVRSYIRELLGELGYALFT